MTVNEALDHAERIITERGVGALTVAEIARAMGMRPPSLYKYFSSLHGVYDELFARGNKRLVSHVDDATQSYQPGLDRLLESTRAIMRWSILNPGLASLLFWRPIPGFQPRAETHAIAETMVQRSRADLSVAAQKGSLAPNADSDEVFRLFTAISAGLCSQQLANEPQATYETGLFTSLTDEALDMFVQRYAPSPS
ncbi:TetR/AcrR family transcriptional regulator [Aeromicrobium sp.]|uniref:TetR/AcrR family transcriptional regulator n=1 Tax=Aeromicrobium sp. TaxID=1871063 RepID=UPI003C3696DE